MTYPVIGSEVAPRRAQALSLHDGLLCHLPRPAPHRDVSRFVEARAMSGWVTPAGSGDQSHDEVRTGVLVRPIGWCRLHPGVHDRYGTCTSSCTSHDEIREDSSTSRPPRLRRLQVGGGWTISGALGVLLETAVRGRTDRGVHPNVAAGPRGRAPRTRPAGWRSRRPGVEHGRAFRARRARPLVREHAGEHVTRGLWRDGSVVARRRIRVVRGVDIQTGWTPTSRRGDVGTSRSSSARPSVRRVHRTALGAECGRRIRELDVLGHVVRRNTTSVPSSDERPWCHRSW